MATGDAIGGSLDGRRIRFWTSLGADVFQLVSFRGCEAVSRLYSFQLKFRTSGLVDKPLNALLGTPAVIEIELPNPTWESLDLSGNLPQLAHRRFCGILSTVAQVGEDELYTHFRATLVPQLYQRRLGAAFRAFHQQSTQEIVSSVLQTMAIRWEISQPLAKRNYTVQYGESDFAFISRLLEEDGLFYFFEHKFKAQPDNPAEARERLVICDSVERLESLSDQSTFDYDEVAGGNRGSMRIRRFNMRTRIVEPKVDSLDRHFQLPTQPVLGSSGLAEKIAADGSELAITPPAEVPPMLHYPADFASRYDDVSSSGASQPEDLQQIFETSERDARLRSERLACNAVRFWGSSDVAVMAPGYLFQLRKGVRTGQPFYLTEVRHEARLANSDRSGKDIPKLLYKNQFRCLPKTLAYRPERKHRKRRVTGVVPALVVNDANVTEDQVCVDIYGRIKVQFPWQQSDQTTPSCWIRVSQFWAGKRWGAFFWPRVGQEVLVAFEHGDPERPVVVGSVYNSENMPPLVLPRYKLSCGVHSCSHQGNPLKNYNAVVFHDQPDDEFLQLHSETFECLTSETESLHHSAGKNFRMLGSNGFFDLVSDISGMGGGEEEGDDGTRARFGAKGRTGNIIGILQLIGIIPRAGSVEVTAGAKIGKTIGREWESCFGPRTHFIFDVVSMFRKAAASKITSPSTLGKIGRFIVGPGASQSDTALIIGEDHKIVYGNELKALHGEEFHVHFPPHDLEKPEGNAGIILVGVGDFAKTLIMVMGFLDLICAIISKILLEVGGSGKKANSYTLASDIIECVIGVVMPKLLSILVKSQEIGARLQMGTQSASQAVTESEAFFTYVLARNASPAFKSAITEELDIIKERAALQAVLDAVEEDEAALELIMEKAGALIAGGDEW